MCSFRNERKGWAPIFRRGQENSLAEQVGNRMNGNLTQPVGQGTEKEETAT